MENQSSQQGLHDNNLGTLKLIFMERLAGIIIKVKNCFHFPTTH